jgi:protein TonB
MKKIAFMLLVALLSTTTITAQKTVISKNQSKDIVFDVVENMPEFPGGQDSLISFLMHTVKYPKEAMSKGIQGRVLAKFIVEKDGQVSTPQVIKSVYPALDEEALRVIRCMPRWKPGKQNGKEVRVFFTLPVTFRLD